MSINLTLSGASRFAGTALSASKPRASETLATPATASTSVANQGEMWTITAEIDLFIEFGATPTGVAPRWRMKAGESRQWFASAQGEKVAYATS